MLYRLISALLLPAAWWGRMRVSGLEAIPPGGPVLIVPNHDSQWDPVMVALAARPVRQLRFLARASLWRIPGLGPLLYRLGQIPIERGAGDAAALGEATEALRGGEAICVFPEGKLSRGESLRARTGVARLAEWCPEARIVLCSVEGATEFAGFPRRPRVRVGFFTPAGGDPAVGENEQQLATRLLDELRERVPPVAAGRRG